MNELQINEVRLFPANGARLRVVAVEGEVCWMRPTADEKRQPSAGALYLTEWVMEWKRA